MAKRILLEIGAGELLDRLTILELKAGFVPPGKRRVRVEQELSRVARACARAGVLSPAFMRALSQLRAINSRLWQAEDNLRLCERQHRFDARFVTLARSVYQQNDRRAAVKLRIDRQSGSPVREEKIFQRSARRPRPQKCDP